MKSQSTTHNKNPKSCQTEDNHLTKQAHYLLPTLEWEPGLQRWRARTLSLNSGTGKTICLSTLFTEFNPFSVSWLSKIQHTVWLYQRFKNFWLQLEKFYLMSHLWALSWLETVDILILQCSYSNPSLDDTKSMLPWCQISSSLLPWDIHTNTEFNTPYKYKYEYKFWAFFLKDVYCLS